MFSFLNFIILLAKSQEKTKKKYKGVDILKIDKKKTIEELAREERLAYFREWRANNKDKVKQHQATYWQRRAERTIAERQAKKNE